MSAPSDNDFEMKAYYKERAPIYDKVYAYPERQEDLRFLEAYIPKQLAGLDVLEIAAGTGYWTQFIARSAKSILATDATIEALTQINHRPINKPVPIQVMDAYAVETLPGGYDGVFSGLWLSHVPKQKLRKFLSSLNQITQPGATVLFIDNSTAQCVRLPIAYTDEKGNKYQDRTLDDGKTHRVLKNFPTENELLEASRGLGVARKYKALEHFWLFQYKTK